MKDLLPIGSVVTLKEGKKKLMIIGRIQENEKTKKLYDYAGCNWPEGYMDKDHCYVFNHEDIDCLYYIGLQDIEELNIHWIEKWCYRLKKENGGVQRWQY